MQPLSTDSAKAPSIGLDAVSPASNQPQDPFQSTQACTLLHMLAGCCHPRADRLRERLGANPGAQQIDHLHSEVLRLLTMCYDGAEVRRRLRELAAPA